MAGLSRYSYFQLIDCKTRNSLIRNAFPVGWRLHIAGADVLCIFLLHLMRAAGLLGCYLNVWGGLFTSVIAWCLKGFVEALCSAGRTSLNLTDDIWAT